MTADRVTVRERLAPEITASLFANYRSSVDALLELVDNSVDSRVGSQQLRVDLILRTDWLQVTTVGGQGMGPRDVEGHYLRWGGSPKRGRNLLGQYGQGGKAAIGHLGRRFTIEASRAGDGICWQFSDPDYRDRSKLKVYELTPSTKRVEAALGYVRIRIDGVDRKVDAKRVVQRLAETYRPLLESESLALSVNGSPLRSPPIVAERRPFRVNAASGRLTGWFGVLAEDGPAADPGIRCYRLGRLVGSGEFFGHPTPAQNPGLTRLVGEVDVPNVQLTMNKSDFDRDSESWLEVEARMHRLLGPLVRRLLREDEAPPSAGALKVAEQVRKLLSQALRLADRPELFAGAETAPAVRPGDAGGQEDLPIEQPPPAPPEPRAPRSPGPPASPGQTRRAGFGRIVLRPLERSRRSQTVVEDGVRLIVINTRHPLFIERKGDTWYQLETAAREVFALQEGASVAEYERQVNEVVMLAVDLRARRRRGARPRTSQLKLV
jgi:Histidine kinase-, DNA gyrase B-, and HSP90-like ATPase